MDLSDEQLEELGKEIATRRSTIPARGKAIADTEAVRAATQEAFEAGYSAARESGDTAAGPALGSWAPAASTISVLGTVADGIPAWLPGHREMAEELLGGATFRGVLGEATKQGEQLGRVVNQLIEDMPEADRTSTGNVPELWLRELASE